MRLLDRRRGELRLRGAGIGASFQAAGLAVPYASGLRRLRGELPRVDLVIVERAPAGFRAATQSEGVSWLDVDGGGSVLVGSERVLFDASAREADRPRRRPGVSPFAGAASRVLRVLLSELERGWRLSELAELASVNPGNAHRVLGELVQRGHLEREGYSYRLVDAGRLLDAWALHYEPPRQRIACAADEPIASVVVGLVDGVERAVVSGELAAEAIAPLLPARSAVVHCLDERAFAEVARRAQELPAASGRAGGVLVDLADPGCGAFSVERAGLPLAAPAQVYLDLARRLDRGREAAEHLRQQALGF
ncbi:MAG: type IV toxin-antitoxin system AbiEi family antitoxin [Solirubrobacteraceae bacterium]